MRSFVLFALAALTACGNDTDLCGTSQTECGTGADFYCADLATDVNDCGACGASCEAGERCVEGGCIAECAAGLDACGDECAELDDDPDHCGACGEACAVGEACVDGACTCGFASMELGRLQSCGVRTDGAVVCAGLFNTGCWTSQLPDGTGTCNATVAGPSGPWVVSSLGVVERLAVGDGHACTLPGDGSVWCIGTGIQGVLGNGAMLPSTDVAVQVRTAVTPATFLAGVTEVDVSSEHVCAIRTGGELWCWGNNNQGQLGTGASGASSAVAVQATLPAGLVPTQIALGEQYSCVLDDGGTVWCWGRNNDYQTGTNAAGTVLTPTEIPALTGVVAISSEQDFSCALRSDGAVWCWGRNHARQLGLPPATIRSVPVQIMAAAATPLIAAEVDVGTSHICARKADGTVWCWGRNRHGQLGDGTFDHISAGDNNSNADTGTNLYPVQVLTAPGSPLVATSLAASHAHSCAIVGPEEHPYCWGHNLKGQSGIAFQRSAYAVPFQGCGL